MLLKTVKSNTVLDICEVLLGLPHYVIEIWSHHSDIKLSTTYIIHPEDWDIGSEAVLAY
jgi:hypothetical protein